MGKSAFQEILESVMSGGMAFQQDPPLGEWVHDLHLKSSPRLRFQEFPYRHSKTIDSESPAKEEAPISTLNINWSNELTAAKLFFNYYGKISVSEKSPKHTIKRAYRQLLYLFHPDSPRARPNASEEFHQLQRAYKALIHA